MLLKCICEDGHWLLINKDNTRTQIIIIKMANENRIYYARNVYPQDLQPLPPQKKEA